MSEKVTYQEQINKVQDYIERHLAGSLQVRELAKVAGFSEYHFQRVFSLVTGESLYAFVKRLRLEKAAYSLLSNPDLSLTDIALNVGFSNPASFAKAFKARFGVSGSEYRKSMGHLDESLFVEEMKKPDALAIEPLSIEMVTEKEQQVIYVRYKGPYKGDSHLFSRLFNRLYTWSSERNLINESSRWFVIYHDQGIETEEELLRLSVCLTVKGNVAVSGPVGVMNLAGGLYGVGRFMVNDQEYGKAWYHMYNYWLASSDYVPDDRHAFEHYPPQVEGHERQLVEIYVPVKKVNKMN